METNWDLGQDRWRYISALPAKIKVYVATDNIFPQLNVYRNEIQYLSADVYNNAPQQKQNSSSCFGKRTHVMQT